jgi:diguanylate cyclase (GGDEF)-like protein
MKLLVADDDGIGRLLLSRQVVSLGFEVMTATDGDEAWNCLRQEGGPQITILDWNIRGLSAGAVCENVRTNGIAQHMVALVPRNDRHQAERALEAGCDDYLTKPAEPAELRARLRIASRIVDLSRRIAEVEEHEYTEASHDRLTGVWNRAAILQFLKGQFARSSRDGVSVAVVVANLDRFGAFNDRYGRPAGNAVLKQIATRMRNTVRPYDWLGRFDGDAFLIIAPDCTLSNGFAMCERLRTLVAETALEASGTKCNVTMSFGVATSAESGVISDEGLLRAAEAALYQAKQNGRNRVEMARRTARLRSVQARAAVTSGRELVQ